MSISCMAFYFFLVLNAFAPTKVKASCACVLIYQCLFNQARRLFRVRAIEAVM